MLNLIIYLTNGNVKYNKPFLLIICEKLTKIGVVYECNEKRKNAGFTENFDVYLCLVYNFSINQ